MKRVVIYHAPCFDGFTAAWVAYQRFGDVDTEYVSAKYGDAPPDVTGADVYILDFSYTRDVLLEMADKANVILILDHHKTARADLENLAHPHVKVLFDMERSGAGLAWDVLMWTTGRPALVDYVEDRDLWRFALPQSREVHEALGMYEFSFDTWTALAGQPIQKLMREGELLVRKKAQEVEQQVKVTGRRMLIAGYDVPVANIPMTHGSEAGNKMAVGEPFAAVYMDTPAGRQFSLRSAPDGIDVSEVAKQFGGGGHAHAAGFLAPLPLTVMV